MEETREIIAENIARLRKANKLTQAELAERLNYSDKAVSKWERGDSIPDVIVLNEIAQLFSVTVDYFLHKHNESERCPKPESHKTRMRVAISLTVFASLYAVVLLLYLVFGEINNSHNGLWKLFILPLPMISLLFLVFCAVWAKSKYPIILGVSLLLWSVILSIFVFLSALEDSWLLFVVGIPFQAIILFWLIVIRRRKDTLLK